MLRHCPAGQCLLTLLTCRTLRRACTWCARYTQSWPASTKGLLTLSSIVTLIYSPIRIRILTLVWCWRGWGRVKHNTCRCLGLPWPATRSCGQSVTACQSLMNCWIGLNSFLGVRQVQVVISLVVVSELLQHCVIGTFVSWTWVKPSGPGSQVDQQRYSGTAHDRNRYILLIEHYFTKFANLYTLPKQIAHTVASCLSEDYILLHGVLEVLYSRRWSRASAICWGLESDAPLPTISCGGEWDNYVKQVALQAPQHFLKCQYTC